MHLGDFRAESPLASEFDEVSIVVRYIQDKMNVVSNALSRWTYNASLASMDVSGQKVIWDAVPPNIVPEEGRKPPKQAPTVVGVCHWCSLVSADAQRFLGWGDGSDTLTDTPCQTD